MNLKDSVQKGYETLMNSDKMLLETTGMPQGGPRMPLISGAAASSTTRLPAGPATPPSAIKDRHRHSESEVQEPEIQKPKRTMADADEDADEECEEEEEDLEEDPFIEEVR